MMRTKPEEDYEWLCCFDSSEFNFDEKFSTFLVRIYYFGDE